MLKLLTPFFKKKNYFTPFFGLIFWKFLNKNGEPRPDFWPTVFEIWSGFHIAGLKFHLWKNDKKPLTWQAGNFSDLELKSQKDHVQQIF